MCHHSRRYAGDEFVIRPLTKQAFVRFLSVFSLNNEEGSLHTLKVCKDSSDDASMENKPKRSRNVVSLRVYCIGV